MKHKIIDAFFILLSLLLCVTVFSTPLTAAGAEEDESLMDRIEKNMNISLVHTGHKERVIRCFDVNENGWFAVVYAVDMIYVFDQNGIFQYGFRFDSDSAYGITFQGDLVGFYIVRGGVMAYFDPAGNCVSAEKVNLSREEQNEILYRTHKRVGNTQYSLERDIGLFVGDYSRVVATDASGNRNVLYDVTVAGLFAGAFHYILALLVPLGFILVIAKKLKEGK